MKRPLPKSWPDRVREKLRQVARDNPDLHITVTPRHRISGPHHRFDGPICHGCKEPVTGGPLHEVLLCGECRRRSDLPPAA